MSMIDSLEQKSAPTSPPIVDVNEMQFGRLGLISVVERAVKKNGQIVTLNLPGGQKMTVLGAASHGAFWQANPTAFHKDLNNPKSGAALTRQVLGDTLLTAKAGPEWEQMRREMVSLLSVSKPWFQRPLRAATDQLVRDLVERPDLPLLEHCIAWATRAICDPLIGERALDASAQKIVHELNSCFLALLSDPNGADVAATQKQYADVMARIAQQRGPDSVANHILSAAPQDADHIELLKNVVGGLLVASLHINALSLFWALTQIAENAALQNRIGVEALIWEDKMRRAVDTPLAYACVRESQRIKPVMAFIERQVTEPIEIGNHKLAAGDTVLFSPWLAQRSADVWANPLTFNPDNFAKGARHPVGSYFPFGLGARQCPGVNLVNQQLTFAISGVFHKLRLAPHADTRPGDIAPMFRVNLEPRGHVRLSVTPIRSIQEKEKI